MKSIRQVDGNYTNKKKVKRKLYILNAIEESIQNY